MGGGQAGARAGGPAAKRSLGLGPGPWGGSLSRAPLGPPDIPLPLPSPTCPLACLLRGERHRNPVWPDSFPSPAGLGVGVGVGVSGHRPQGPRGSRRPPASFSIIPPDTSCHWFLPSALSDGCPEKLWAWPRSRGVDTGAPLT